MFQMIDGYDIQKVGREAREEEKNEMVRKMIKKGIDIETIMEIIELSEEKIKEIKAQQK